jgi:hypothetical protein
MLSRKNARQWEKSKYSKGRNVVIRQAYLPLIRLSKNQCNVHLRQNVINLRVERVV